MTDCFGRKSNQFINANTYYYYFVVNRFKISTYTVYTLNDDTAFYCNKSNPMWKIRVTLIRKVFELYSS